MFTRSQLFLTLIACLICLAFARPEKKRFNKRQAVDINLSSSTVATAAPPTTTTAASSSSASMSSTAATFVPTTGPSKLDPTTTYSSKFVFTYSLKDTTPLADGSVYFSLWPSMASSSRSSKSAAKASSKASKKAAKSKSNSDDN